MPSHIRQFLAPVAVASLAAATLVAAAPVTQAHPSGPTAVAASPDISVANTQAHLNQLQSIATANGGNRYTGRPGYTASINYVKGKLDAAGYTTTVQNFSTSAGTSSNLIAEWPAGDANNVVMLGGHLDSVSNGPGINDNGSGSAGVLEAALAYAASGQSAKSRLRIGFWGAEELGLLGSKYYMNSLPTTEKNKIRVYLNFDMIGSPNPGYFVYDDNAAGNGARDELTAWYTSKGIPWEYIDVQGRSDHAAFRSYGIATAGIFSGAETLKSTSQATKWGGTAGRAFDPCYHSSCDTISNINVTSLDRGVDLIGHMLWLYAAKDYGTTPPPTGGNLLLNPGFESGAVNWTGTSGPITSNSGRPGSHGHLEGVAGWQRLDLDRDDPAERRDPVDRHGSDPVVLAAHRHGRVRQHGLRHVEGAGRRWFDDHHPGDVLQRRCHGGIRAEVPQPHGIQGQDRRREAPHERGLLVADVVRRRRHGGQHQLNRPLNW